MGPWFETRRRFEPPQGAASLCPGGEDEGPPAAMGVQDRPQCFFEIEINREPGEPFVTNVAFVFLFFSAFFPLIMDSGRQQ